MHMYRLDMMPDLKVCLQADVMPLHACKGCHSQRHAPSSLRAQDWHDALPCCCRYVESFDQATMLEMTQVVSAEGAALVEAQTGALFGDLKALQRQMQASELHISSYRMHLSACNKAILKSDLERTIAVRCIQAQL